MNIKNCPCCPNHCQKNDLRCERGRDYYSNLDNPSKANSLDEEIIINLRKCGHMLHHNKELDTIHLLAKLSNEEKQHLNKLLFKVLDNVE